MPYTGTKECRPEPPSGTFFAPFKSGFPCIERLADPAMFDFVERKARKDQRTRRVAESWSERKQGAERQFCLLGLLLVGKKIELLKNPPG